MDEADFPYSIGQWSAVAKKYGVETHSVHSYKLPSASNAGLQQFLLLRAYWPARRRIEQFDDDYQSGRWIRHEHIANAQKELSNPGYKSWQNYLDSFGLDFRSLNFQGTFALARYYQHLSTQHNGRPNGSSQPKVYFTPRQTRSMTRAAAAAEASPSIRPKQPRTPPEAYTDNLLGGLNDTMGSLSLQHNKYDPFSTPLFSMARSPEDVDDVEMYKAIEDEQIVNTALVGFLNALTLHSSAEGEWSLNRKPFVVKDAQRSKVFEARVDGVLRSSTGTNAIIEVKPMARSKKDGAWNKIRIQETAQMAAWIAAERPETAVMPRLQQSLNLDVGSKSKAATLEPKVHRRLLVSQDRHEIFLTVATFDDYYVHYVSGIDDTVQGSFLEMQEYGPYDVGDRKSMKVLGGIMLAISMQGGIE